MIKFLSLLFFLNINVNAQKSMVDISSNYINALSSFTSKVGLVYFESTDGIVKDGIIFTEKLLEEIVKDGRIKVIDPMMMADKFRKIGAKRIGELDYDSTLKMKKDIGTDYIIIGSVSRRGKLIESRGRIIKLPELEVIKVLNFTVYSDWDYDKTKSYALKGYEKINDDIKPTKDCPYPELVKIALKNEESKYTYVCAKFSCEFADCSKYPTAEKSIYKIYFKDPKKKVITTDDSFNLIEEYYTDEK